MAIVKSNTNHGLMSAHNGLTRRQSRAYRTTVTRRLGLDTHREFSRILIEGRGKNTDRTRRGWLDSARCVLDDIVQCEHTEAPDAVVLRIYYGQEHEPTHRDAYAALRQFCDQLAASPALNAPGYDPRYRLVLDYIEAKLARYPPPRRSKVWGLLR